MSEPLTPSQTIGPFFHEGMRWAFAAAVPKEGARHLSGRVVDGDGAPVGDALLEAWTPSAAGLPGLQRVASGPQGEFSLRLPRGAPGEPALHLTLFARGMLQHRFTAVFLSDDPGLDSAALLLQVPAARRTTLIARPTPAGYHWDLHLQGPDETVFFDYE